MSDNEVLVSVVPLRHMLIVLLILGCIICPKQIMNFGDCLVRTEGALAIADTMSSNEFSMLKEIILSFNEIRKDGAFKVAQVGEFP